MPEQISVETLTDHDVETLTDLSTCLLSIWSREKEMKNRKKIYDNSALDAFMAELTVMIHDISSKKSISDYISYVHGPYLTIEVPVRY